MLLLKIVLVIIIAVVILYIAGSVYYFRLATVGRDVSKIDDGTESGYTPKGWESSFDAIVSDGRICFDQTDFEEVEVESFDGLKLRGLLKTVPNSNGTLIFMHGYRSTPRHDFSGLFPFFSSFGYNMLFPFQRAHGRSEGKYITFGVRERKDAVRWCEFINNKQGYQQNIFMIGISMGCTTVVMGAGSGYPDNVRGVIADCGYTSPKEIIKSVARKLIPVEFLIKPFVFSVDFLCKHFAGFSLSEYSTLDALSNTELPILFIHGEDDDFVPCEMTSENHRSYKGKKNLLLVPGASHAVSCIVDNENYKKNVIQFINENSN